MREAGNLYGSQPGTALGTACLDHPATRLRCHTRAKTVGTRPLQYAWLKCSFHRELPTTKVKSIKLPETGRVKGRAGYVSTG